MEINHFWDLGKSKGNVALTNNNLTVKLTGGNPQATVFGNTPILFNKCYFEIKYESFVGVQVSAIGVGQLNATTYNNNVIIYTGDRRIHPEALPSSGAINSGTVISILIDKELSKVEFWLDGVYQGESKSLDKLSEVYPMINLASGGTDRNSSFTANFGETPFAYEMPEGYRSYDGKQYSGVHKILLSSTNNEVKSIDVTLGGKKFDSIYKGATVTLSDNDKTALISGNANTTVGEKVISEGKHYWEFAWDSGSYPLFGVTKDGENLSSITYSTGKSRYYYSNGSKYETGASSYGVAYTAGDIISVLLDMDDGTIEFWKNGITQGVAFTNVKDLVSVRPSYTRGSSGNATVTIRCTEEEFSYSVPEGYKAYGKDIGIVKETPSKSEKSFINHGMSQEDLASIDMSSEFNEKHYIQDTPAPLGEGKVFKHDLNTTKIINKISIK